MSLVMIRSVVRPERADQVLDALMQNGFPAVTKFPVAGRGKQRGIKIGDVTYDELPKLMIMAVVSEKDKDLAVATILESARTGERGNFGDGKIFVSSVDEMYTISSGDQETEVGGIEEDQS